MKVGTSIPIILFVLCFISSALEMYENNHPSTKQPFSLAGQRASFKWTKVYHKEGPKLYQLLLKMLSQQFVSSVFIFCGDDPKDLSSVVQLFHSHMVNVILQSISTENLENSLQTKILSPENKVGVILASKNETLSFFQKIREMFLENPNILWMFSAQEDLSEVLRTIISEGTQIIALQDFRNNSGILQKSSVDKNSKFIFEEIGRWVENNGSWDLLLHFENFSWFPKFRSFEGRHLNVTANNDWPFFGITFLEDGKPVPASGIDVEVLSILSQKLNFTYDVIIPADKSWGGPTRKGQISGMIGVVARREAYLAIDEITITVGRERVVDFSYPYFMEPSIIISKAPVAKKKDFAILAPFSAQIWGFILLSTILTAPLLLVATKIDAYNKGERPTGYLQKFYLNVYRSLMLQQNLLQTSSNSTRAILLSWYFFCLNISVIYSGTLMAVLVVPVYEKSIESLEDLQYTAHRGEVIPMDASFGIFKEVYKYFDPQKSLFELTPYAFEKGRRKQIVYSSHMRNISSISIFLLSTFPIRVKTAEGGVALIHSEFNARSNTVLRGIQKYHLSKETFAPQMYAVTCPNGAPYVDVINKLLLNLQSSGLIGKWKRDVLYQKVPQPILSAQKKKKQTKGPEVISLVHIQAAFIVFASGLFLSILTLFSEILKDKYFTHQN